MLIEVDELHAVLGQSDVVIFDCRFQLADPEVGRKQYENAHIPGAFYLDLDRDLTSHASIEGGRHPLPELAVFTHKLQGFGVTPTKQIIIYDGGEGMAARAWWLMRYVGLAHVSLLNGGYSAWVKAGYPQSSKISIATPAPPFAVQPRTDWVVDAAAVQSVLTSLDTGIILVDARAHERFRGEVEPIDPVAGHIPGARNRPWMNNFASDGRFLSAEALRVVYADMVDANEVIAYCGSGVTACVDIFALHLVGLQSVKLYAGSWSEWCQDPTRPIEQG